MESTVSQCLAAITIVGVLAGGQAANAQEAADGMVSRTWSLTIGAEVFRAPNFAGSRQYMISAKPLISLGRAGSEARFTSRNDNISLAFIDTGAFRAGAVGMLVFPRDANDEAATLGLSDVPFGVELGGFAEVYPTDWLRVRGELRQGIRAHKGLVADVAADAFIDVTDTMRVSAGPRASWASSDYFDAYYGVTAQESVASGLPVYDPTGGAATVGAGGAVTWKATDRVTASVFGEYSRLVGSAARSSLVEDRGSKNQFLFGMSTTYRFDFDL